jgi:hypothetical protein
VPAEHLRECLGKVHVVFHEQDVARLPLRLSGRDFGRPQESGEIERFGQPLRDHGRIDLVSAPFQHAQDHHRNVPRLGPLFQYGQSVPAICFRDHKIKQDRCRSLRYRVLDRFAPRANGCYLIPVLLELRAKQCGAPLPGGSTHVRTTGARSFCSRSGSRKSVPERMMEIQISPQHNTFSGVYLSGKRYAL